jgi:hypothetical protein
MLTLLTWFACCLLQVATAAVELRLSSLSELLGLTAAASDWLQLAAPDRWPSPEQVQQAEQSRAVQKLARDVLQAHSVSACAAVSDGSGGSKSSDQLPKQVPDTAAFLLAAAQGVQTGTLSAWLAGRPLDGYTKDPAVDNTSKVDAGDGSWGSRVGSAQGGRRPVSSAGARAGAAAAALAAGAPSRSSNGSSRHVQLLHVKPLADLDSWVSIARYLVDHAQYTAGQKLCAVALEQARCAGGQVGGWVGGWALGAQTNQAIHVGTLYSSLMFTLQQSTVSRTTMSPRCGL